MSKVCIATVVSADTFEYYIPLFVYTAKRAYPSYHIKIFLNGKLKPKVKAILDKIPWQSGWDIIEDAFDFKLGKYHHNAMRFLLGPENFVGFHYVYITDIDFLIFKHSPTLKGKMEELRGDNLYVGARVSYRAITRRGVTKRWTRKYKRIAGGRVWLKNPEWFKATKKAREYYLDLARRKAHDDVDKHEFGAYREFDEVMLVRMCNKSKIKTPKIPGTTLNGNRIGKLYRDIHLGDFKFKRRGTSTKKMTRRINIENVGNYQKLEKEPEWQEIRKMCYASGTIKEIFGRLRWHVKARS